MCSKRYRAVRFGVETLAARIVLPRHRHMAGYATVALAGVFEEASFAGHFIVEPGDVLLHARFDCHADRAVSMRAPQILRLPWNDDALEGHFRVHNPDSLVRLAEEDPFSALALLRTELRPASPREWQWTDKLALALKADSSISLQDWGEAENLAPETLSRGFGRVFGVTPKLFRLESRARRAWHAMVRSRAPLTEIAYEYGFSDLAHLSRTVRSLTGFAPSRWRTGNNPAAC
jgi:AraC-like DNA-binding protein